MIISKRLFIGFSIVISLAIIVGIMGITGMNRLREASHSVYESHVLGLEYTGKAAVAFEQARLHCRQIVICSYYDDLWGAYETKNEFVAICNDFRYWLKKGMEAAASDELTRFYERISYVFENEFIPQAEDLIDESIQDIPDHGNALYVNVLLESLIESGNQLQTVILGSMNLNTALVNQANSDNNHFTQLFVLIQTLLLCAAVIAAIVIALFITKSITVPINEAANVLSNVARGDFEARVKGEYKGELGLIKNSVNETAAQISVYLKEKMQEEKTKSFAAMLSLADAGIIIKDKDGLITNWNVGAEKILGYTHSEIIGKSSKFITPEDLHYTIDITQEQHQKGQHTANTEDISIHKDGRLITCSASQTPLFDEEGNFSGSVVIFHDVTEKRIAEQKIKRFAAIIESADACIITTDKNLVIQGWNRGAENIMGYSAQEIIGKTADYFWPESEKPKIYDMIKQLRSGKRIGRTDITQRHKNGSLIDCSVYYTPYFDDSGSFDGVVAFIHDLSERKKMEKELQIALQAAEDASKVKSTFLANMSHEIRTPMNAVISMTELLLEEKLPPRLHRYLLDIKVSGTILLDIINDILDFSKIESGKFEILPVHFDFALLLKNIQSTFEFISRDKKLGFIAETEGELPRYLFGDDIRIRQILTNLLSNAIKFTSRGHVSLKTRVDAHWLYFDVADTGIGIKEEGLSKLFDSFQQLDAAANRQRSGTGLGLSITKSLVEMMGGFISVESEYGAGTVFHVVLPRIDGDPKQLKPDITGNIQALYAPEAQVLIVDDYDTNLRVAAGLLELSGIKCDTAINGETALQMVSGKQYDLVFMDHMMPGMDGVETMQHIRAMGGDKRDLPIIALTANAISGVKEMLIAQGMDDFLSKPIDKMLLTEILHKWLSKHKVHIQETEAAAVTDENRQEKKARGFIQNLRAIPEINLDAALKLMGGLEDLYESTFLVAHRKLPENIGKLDIYLETGKLRDFAIEVHGLKSVLKNVGCLVLGDNAANLEKAAKAEDKDYCNQHYGDFRQQIMEFHEKTVWIIEDLWQQKIAQSGDVLLTERLAAARLACEEYNSFSAYEILLELMYRGFPAEVNALIEKALLAAENCDYDEALDFIGQIETLAETST